MDQGGELDDLLIEVARDLWVLMGELATDPKNLHKLKERVSEAMVERLGAEVEKIEARFQMPREFVIPGENRVAALCDVARAVVRRAERAAVAVATVDSFVVPYLNRLSSLLWVLARWQEGGHSLPSRG